MQMPLCTRSTTQITMQAFVEAAALLQAAVWLSSLFSQLYSGTYSRPWCVGSLPSVSSCGTLTKLMYVRVHVVH